MTDQHPITPPPELVRQWRDEWIEQSNTNENWVCEYVATRAARWGADQELEACCEWFVRDWTDIETADKLRAARRSKPKSLGKTALVALETIEDDLMCGDEAHPNDLVAIRRALERLQELEGQSDD